MQVKPLGCACRASGEMRVGESLDSSPAGSVFSPDSRINGDRRLPKGSTPYLESRQRNNDTYFAYRHPTIVSVIENGRLSTCDLPSLLFFPQFHSSSFGCVHLVYYHYHGLEAIFGPSRQYSPQSGRHAGRLPDLHLLWIQHECGWRSVDTRRLQQSISSNGHYSHFRSTPARELTDSRSVDPPE